MPGVQRESQRTRAARYASGQVITTVKGKGSHGSYACQIGSLRHVTSLQPYRARTLTHTLPEYKVYVDKDAPFL